MSYLLGIIIPTWGTPQPQLPLGRQRILSTTLLNYAIKGARIPLPRAGIDSDSGRAHFDYTSARLRDMVSAHVRGSDGNVDVTYTPTVNST